VPQQVTQKFYEWFMANSVKNVRTIVGTWVWQDNRDGALPPTSMPNLMTFAGKNILHFEYPMEVTDEDYYMFFKYNPIRAY
jgi:hypothetical protein